MKILDRISAIDQFGAVAGFRAEVKAETEEGEVIYAYACQIGDADSYAIAKDSIMDAIDETGEDSVNRLESYETYRDAMHSGYADLIRMADRMVGEDMDAFYAGSDDL